MAVIIFVNGYWNSGEKIEKYLSKFSKTFAAKMSKIIANNMGRMPKEGYWRDGFIENAEKYFINLYKTETGQRLQTIDKIFVDGKDDYNSSGKLRFDNGYKNISADINGNENIINQLKNVGAIDTDGKQQKCIYFATHSMGASYAEGMIKGLLQHGMQISRILHFAPADNYDFECVLPANTYQISIAYDLILRYKKLISKNKRYQSRNHWIINGLPQNHFIWCSKGFSVYNHLYLKTYRAWDWIDFLKRT